MKKKKGAKMPRLPFSHLGRNPQKRGVKDPETHQQRTEHTRQSCDYPKSASACLYVRVCWRTAGVMGGSESV